MVYGIGSMSGNIIKFPENNDIFRNKQEFLAITGMPGVVGSIDCTHIPIQIPTHPRPETFGNRKGFPSLNVQAVCGPKLKFSRLSGLAVHIISKFFFFYNSRLCEELEDDLLPGHLLGDSGYPCRNYLPSPVTAPQGRGETCYNAAHIKTRNEHLDY